MVHGGTMNSLSLFETLPCRVSRRVRHQVVLGPHKRTDSPVRERLHGTLRLKTARQLP